MSYRSPERHTSQGTPRQERAQMGDYADDDTRDWGARPSTVGGSKADLPTIAAGGCWCGLRYGHDWPGKDGGAPHPRSTP